MQSEQFGPHTYTCVRIVFYRFANELRLLLQYNFWQHYTIVLGVAAASLCGPDWTVDRVLCKNHMRRKSPRERKSARERRRTCAFCLRRRAVADA